MIQANPQNGPIETEQTAFAEQSSKRLPIVGVLGSGTHPHVERCTRLGTWLATLDVHLLTGGGGGVMLSVSRAFAGVSKRVGLVIGIVPGRIGETLCSHTLPDGYPNPWVEIPVLTHLPDSGQLGLSVTSRNHINVLSSDVLVILPGQLGTAAEAELAVRYNKPVVAWLDDRSQVAGLHPDVPVVKRFKRVKKFVSTNLPS